MSYNIYLRGPTCTLCKHTPEGPDLPDPTYNLSGIFDLALTGKPDGVEGLRVLNGFTGKQTELSLTVALERLEGPELRVSFLALEPKNGWGDLPDAIWVMKALREAAHKYPDHIWEVR